MGMIAGSMGGRTVSSGDAIHGAPQCAMLLAIIPPLPATDTLSTVAARALDGGHPSDTGRRCLGGPLSSFRVYLGHGYDGCPGVPARVQRGHVLRVVGVAGRLRMQHPLVLSGFGWFSFAAAVLDAGRPCLG